MLCYKPAPNSWHRWNVPAPGSATTIAENSTQESKYIPLYPDHKLATTYTYNSTNQVVKQYTPDGGTSDFWYDNLSRLVVSRNEKQLNDNNFSYTAYDALGRITEVAEKKFVGSGLTEPQYLAKEAYTAFLSGGSNSQITQTYYDSIPAAGNGIQQLPQQNLRKRVAASVYRETQNGRALQASYYDYDLAGNVKTLWQQINALGTKQLDYEFDQVSGKVNFVRYQAGQPDQFFYAYKYDAENRLTAAYSGTEALVDSLGGSYLLNKQLDASYQYYLHGPLARMELDPETGIVQGVDYAYTLQGWLKGVNGQTLDASKEIGKDGGTASTIAKDVMGYSLGYYAGDYKPIGGTNAAAFGMEYQGQTGDIAGQNLYNGNISHTTVSISKFRSGAPVGYTYRYDQLNRLKQMRQHHLTAGTTAWNSNSITDSLQESISYDGNGNILSYLRKGNGQGKPLAMDNLSYAYNRDAKGNLINNRLRHVKDDVNSANYTEDIDNQPDDNYTYDEIGNLIKDSQEGITKIDWTVYGKIKSIAKADGKNIAYNYDPSGNRVSKAVNGTITWYVRDAQGNTLALYDNENCFINWKEQQLYGSSRLGMWTSNLKLTDTIQNIAAWDSIGKKQFELGNHLGNVLAVVSDKRIFNSSGTYEAEVVSAQDYYPFGMVQPGRNWQLGDVYRYGFNGKENDNEVKGEGNQQDYGMRIYDTRLGRFLSVDPITKEYPALTPYPLASASVC